MKTVTTWHTMKTFLRSVEIGETVTRKKIIEFNGYDGSSTSDNYRNYLCQAGYMKIVRRGLYEKIKQIPESLTSSGLYEEAYFS